MGVMNQPNDEFNHKAHMDAMFDDLTKALPTLDIPEESGLSKGLASLISQTKGMDFDAQYDVIKAMVLITAWFITRQPTVTRLALILHAWAEEFPCSYCDSHQALETLPPDVWKGAPTC